MDIFENPIRPDCRCAHTDQEREQRTMREQKKDFCKAEADEDKKCGHETQNNVGIVVVGFSTRRNGSEKAVFELITRSQKVKSISRTARGIICKDIIGVASITCCMSKLDQCCVVLWIP